VGAILALIATPFLSYRRLSLLSSLPLGAFLGVAATIAAVYFLGRRDGQIDSTTLLLGGVINRLFPSASSLSPGHYHTGNTRGMVFWLWAIFPLLIKRASIGSGIGFLAAAGAIYTTAF